MPTIYLIVLVTVLTHTSFKRSKVLVSLYAIELDANPLTIRILFGTYAVFPVLLSVYAAKLCALLLAFTGWRWQATPRRAQERVSRRRPAAPALSRFSPPSRRIL